MGVFVFLFKFAGVITTRLSERYVSTKFKAAESLLEEEKLPQDWLDKVTRKAFRRDWMRLRRRADSEKEEDAKEMMIEMLEGLAKYFEKCPFLDTPETRTLLLDRLNALAANWSSKEWREILATYAPQALPSLPA